MSINNKRSYTEYTVTQPTVDFAIGFDDFDEGGKDNILVTLNGVLVESLGYAAIRKNENTVSITPAITEGTVRLTRETGIDEPFHKFTAGALFSAKSMDENFQQVRHSQQEVRDGFEYLEFNTSGIVSAAKSATNRANDAADVVEGLTDAVNDRVHAVEVSQEATNTRVNNFIATDVVPIVNDAINNTAIEGGVLADTFVTVTPNGKGTIARTQRELNQEALSPYDFGAVGDGTHHPLSERYATLDLAKAEYPHVNSLDDSIDWAALQKFFDYCKANVVKRANVGGNFSTNREVNFVQGHGAKTRYIAGHLKITATKDMHHVLRIAGSQLKFDVIECVKTGNANIPYGFFLGGHLNSDSTISTTIGTVIANGFSEASIHVNQNTMFCYIGNCRGRGGLVTPLNFKFLSSGGDAQQQRSVLEVDKPPAMPNDIPKLHNSDHPNQPAFLNIKGRAYRVMSRNTENNTISIFPKYYPTAEELANPDSTIKADYITGCFFYHAGNNAGCIEVGTISALLGGIGVYEGSLYSGVYNNIITEYCGIGIVVGNTMYDPAMVLTINRAYFEANKFDYIQSGAFEEQREVYLRNTVNLDQKKIAILNTRGGLNGNGIYTKTNLNGRLGQGSEIAIGNVTYIASNHIAKSWRADASYRIHLSGQTQNLHYIEGSGDMTLNISIDKEIHDLIGKSEAVIQVHAVNYGSVVKKRITLNVPEGYSIDSSGTTSLVLEGFYKNPVISLCLWDNNKLAVTVDGLKKDLLTRNTSYGITNKRPTNVPVGTSFFDTTLGKPVYYNGTTWVDSVGAVV